MELDYSAIFNVFVDMLKAGIPIAFFLYLANILIHFFFSLAFPKKFRRDE